MKPAASKNRILLALGFFFPLIILVAVAGLAFISSNLLGGSHEWVEHTLEVRDTLDQVLLGMTTIESNQRGYMLSKHERYREEAEKERAQMPPLLARLGTLVADNPNQQLLLPRLDAIIQERLDWASMMIALKQADRGQEMTALMNTGRGQLEIDQVRSIITVMIQEEDRLLTQRRQQVEHDVRVDNTLLMVLVLLDVLVVGGVLYLLLRLRKLQQLVTVCAWSKTIRYNGEWVSIEDYLHQRYGVRVTHGISEAEFIKLSQETEIH